MIISNFLSWLSILNFMYLKLPQKGKLIIIIISLSSYIPLKTLYFFCIRVVHTKDMTINFLYFEEVLSKCNVE